VAVTERQRHQLFERLGETLGEAEAEVLMEYLPPVGWADVATKRDLDAGLAATKRDLDAGLAAVKRDLDAGLAAAKRDLDAGLALLRTELQGDLARLEARFHADQVTFMRLLIGSQFMLALIFVVAQALS
jgi:hypothetical protein